MSVCVCEKLLVTRNIYFTHTYNLCPKHSFIQSAVYCQTVVLERDSSDVKYLKGRYFMPTMATRLRAQRPGSRNSIPGIDFLFFTASTAPLVTPIEMASRVLSAGGKTPGA
jgi:hypothetical protein